MKRLTVCVVTGTRAEFGIWRPVLQRIRASKRLRLRLIVTGMHLLKSFGHTVKDIETAGFPIAAKVPMYRPDETPAQSLARGIEGLAAAFRQNKADIVMVLGDRLEMLAASSSALAEQIPIAHVHGGESAPGIWDEQIRHALTKMAHIHFCSTKTAAERIRRMGEDPGRVHQVGAPALDQVLVAYRAWRPAIPKLRLVAGTHPLLLLHPSSSDDALEFRRTLMLIDLLRKGDVDDPRAIHAVGPNNDPGHLGILRAYREQFTAVLVELSLPQDQFWLELMSCGLLIGNSSAGIIEAASFGIPVINIGNRQSGRERNPNVIDVPWNARAIEYAIHKATSDKSFLRRVAQRKNLYGGGHASEKIVRELERLATTGINIVKQFSD